MHYSTVQKHSAGQRPVGHAGSEGFGRIARCTSSALPVLRVADRSANEADIASRDECEAKARRAAGANGFGDVALTPTENGDFRRPDSTELIAATRSARSRAMGDLAATIWRAAAHWPGNPTAEAKQHRATGAAGPVVPIRQTYRFAAGDSPLLHKTAGMTELVADVSRWVAGVVRRSVQAWRRQRQAHATYLALRDLDARTLRDIGLHHSELRSVAAEVAGVLEATRMHAVHVEHNY